MKEWDAIFYKEKGVLLRRVGGREDLDDEFYER